jgi:CRISPR-associated protein Csb2
VLRLTVRFPLGVYHAQSSADFSQAEWPPHPVRLIAALIAAAHTGPADALTSARAVIDRLAAAPAPTIVAPMAADPADANGRSHVARLRGASRWAPRNHELAELRGGKGISPRDLGRGRAEVHKVGVAVGDTPVGFEWPELTFSSTDLGALRDLAEDVTVLGTARSPVVIDVDDDQTPSPAADAWSPSTTAASASLTQVRVPTARTPSDLDVWHARRAAPLRRSGAPAAAPYVPPAALGEDIGYVHGLGAQSSTAVAFDPRWWGDMLIVGINAEGSEATPKAPAAFALARAMRKAVLETYGPPGTPEEAPAILRARGAEPHVAFVPLSFVAPSTSSWPGHTHADGKTLGIAVVLPHEKRAADVALQRLRVEQGLRALILDGPDGAGVPVRVPRVGSVRLGLVADVRRVAATLREARYREPSDRWSTVTPLVHSRYRPRGGERALYEQVAAECTDVGLPPPARVAVRRVSRFRGAPATIDPSRVPQSWTGPLKGPQAHLDLWFDIPIHGPILLGRARHFGLGLCLPFVDLPDGQT